MSKVYIILENGRVFEGESFGAAGETVGELVFTTGVVGYVETLTETNSYAIDFGLTAQGKIAFEVDGMATQSFDKKLTYEGETGTVVFGGGNGTISLDESGCAESRQRRQVDFSYRDGGYNAQAKTCV